MKGAEFLRRVLRLARRRGWPVEWRPNRGKGIHGPLLLNGRRTVVPNLKSELKAGLYFGLLRNLGLSEENLHDDEVGHPMNAYVYPARIRPAGEGGWLIAFRDFPEGVSQATPKVDAIDIAEGCLQACIEGRLEDGLAIPEPSAPRSGEVLVAVPLETATKAALFAAVAVSGMSRLALARAVGLDEKEIRRMLDPRHSSKLPRIARVLRALGKELHLTVADSPRAPVAASAHSGKGRMEARQRLRRYRVAPRKSASGGMRK